MKPTDVTCTTIVMRGNEFYQGHYTDFYGRMVHLFSHYMFDAKRFTTKVAAEMTAQETGGVVKLLDRANGVLI